MKSNQQHRQGRFTARAAPLLQAHIDINAPVKTLGPLRPGARTMNVVAFTVIHPKPDAKWEDLQKHINRGNDLARKHGAENVTTLVTMAAGTATGTLTVLASVADWTSYGKIQDAMMADPEMQALMADPNSPVARWETHLSQTIPDM